MTQKSKNTEISPGNTLTEAKSVKLAAGEVVLGSFVGLDGNGNPLVSFVVDGEHIENCVAKSTVPVVSHEVGRQVVIMFIDQNLKQPVISGFIHNNLDTVLSVTQEALGAEDQALFPEQELSQPNFEIDGKQQERLVFEGKDEIVLKCGDSSITLTREGKVILRGKYILSRSSGVNRILGGSVQVN